MADQGQSIRIGVRELRGKLGDYLRLAKNGARFVIVSRGEPVAELSAPALPEVNEKPPRKLGVLRGKIWMAQDWDEWPEGFLDAMENGHIEPRP